ncbi:LysR family transcriptional regulator [Pseudomonas aeruginosa]|uniref:LysR family transcriptional regulator n=1 Tax=Pseudomonas aeruginosa TaxID=287 RepID=UPI000FED6373|nr:LysR family transcriptional regulator [Pseudomonas aeruginosa]RPO33999.1 LysR family transcriptional regulator [Pseudomonas aeruginosa]
MNLKFLETFVWVARLKSFRLTAEKLFSTQASISSRIAVLEDELGVKLFVRDSRGVTLTPEGDKVLAYAERMMDTMHALKQSLDTGASTQGRIRIGRVVTFSKHSRPHQDVLGLLHANGVAAPRLNCVNSVAAMTRLLRDGFGVGALPPALVSQELERGELTLLRLGPPPPNLPVVVSWRGGTGLELVDEVVELSKAVLADYAANVGPECMLLAPLKKGVGRLRSR